LIFDRLACELCGSITQLEVHHINPKRMGGSRRPQIEAPENKISICRSCHIEITENRWHLERTGKSLVVTRKGTSETILRRLYNPAFDASQYFHRLTLLDLELDGLIQGIPYLTDEQLVELFGQLAGFGKTAWKARAAILWETKQRSVYGDKAWEAMGRTFSVGWRQAYNLARVWETFFKGDNGQFCNQLQNCSLEESTWYVVATETQAPHFWLAYAEDRKSFDAAYSISDFKEEIRVAGAKAEEDACPSRTDSGRCRWLRVYCTKLDRVVRQGECPGCDVLPSIQERLR
jgi:HNH endonuclease